MRGEIYSDTEFYNEHLKANVYKQEFYTEQDFPPLFQNFEQKAGNQFLRMSAPGCQDI